MSAELMADSSKGEVLHVVSCNAPTFGASREEKDSFYSLLQDVLSSIPSKENFVLLGDFNARVGSRSENDEWWDERGPHGHGVLKRAAVLRRMLRMDGFRGRRWRHLHAGMVGR